jgi:hypothetical protein
VGQTDSKLLDLQARRIEKALDETPADLVDELHALMEAMKPILDRLERDLERRLDAR